MLANKITNQINLSLDVVFYWTQLIGIVLIFGLMMQILAPCVFSFGQHHIKSIPHLFTKRANKTLHRITLTLRVLGFFWLRFCFLVVHSFF